MSNNQLYIKDPVSGKTVLLAKGWEYGWEVWHEDDLADRLQKLFNSCRDDGREMGSLDQDTTLLVLETEKKVRDV